MVIPDFRFLSLLGLSLLIITFGIILTLKMRLSQPQREIEPTPIEHFYCYNCGYGTEHVQDCQFEDGQMLVHEPLCFACAVARDAVVLISPL